MADIKSRVKDVMHSDPDFNNWKGKIQKRVNKSNAAEQERLKRIAAYRKEASRLASMANKRIQRLENRDVKASPAYDRWLRDGAVKFSVRGKDHNELQKEVARMNRFLNSVTSTIRGTSKVLKEIAANTNLEYRNMKHLFELAPKFFELSDKIKEHLRVIEDAGSALGYQQIWTAINEYVKSNEIDLSSTEAHLDSMIKIISDALMDKLRAPAKPRIKWSPRTSK